MNQTANAASKTKIGAMYRQVAITADNSGQLPERIELMRTGEWPAASNKGPLQETVASLNEYKRNYDAGVAQSMTADGTYVGLPIDFMHEDWNKAAAWIKGMEVAPSSTPELPADAGGMSLWASKIEYTTAGKEAILGGEFKCFSPSWWPASRGDWTDPEDPNITARNVIVGGGLTNSPFFKGLTSLTASNASDKDGKINQENVIYIKADKEKIDMKLDEIRVKEASTLTADEKVFLADHKSELSPAELTNFGLVEAEQVVEPAVDPATNTNNNNEENEPVADPELEAVTASIKKGESVVVKASVFNKMQADVTAMKREKIEASVKEHAGRGAIKADQIENWTDRILKDESLSDVLAALPSHPVMAAEKGSSVKASEATGAIATLNEKVAAAIKASKEAGNELDYGRAVSQVRAENPTLATEADNEMKEGN